MYVRFLMLITLVAGSCSFIDAQNQEESDGRVKVKERVVDEKGNVISERIYYEYEEGDGDFLDFPGTFDLEGLGFEDLFGNKDFFTRSDGQPVMGITLSFEDGTGKVKSVSKGSCADDVDIRENDEVISIEGVAVATIQDVEEVLADKEAGDIVRVVIFRDGEEITKRVELGRSTLNNFFFDMPEGGLDFFGGDLDSLFEGGFNFEKPMDFWGKFFNENFDGWDDLNRGNDQVRRAPPREGDISERVTLGIFVEDIGSGVLITEVLPDSTGKRLGLKENDVIVKVDDQSINGTSELIKMMDDKRVGDTILLELERSGRMVIIEMPL